MNIVTNVAKPVDLGEVCEFRYGKSLPASLRRPGSVPVFGSNGQVGVHDAAQTEGETIIVGRKGSIGEISYSPVPCWPIDTTYYVDHSCTDQHLGWLAWALRSLRLTELNKSAAVPGLNREDAYRQKILLPSLPEQRRIAAILDQADALQAKRRAALALLDEMAQAIFVDMFGDLTANARNWPTVPISEACALLVDCVNRTAPLSDEPTAYKMIRTTNVRNGRLDTTSTRYVTKETFERWNRRATPTFGDLILTREAPVGEAAIINSRDHLFLGQRLMLYRARPFLSTAEYLLFSFRDPFVQSQLDRLSSGSTVKHLPLPVCRSFLVRLPDYSLQQQFSQRLRALNTIHEKAMISLAATDSLFASLQHRAFRGVL